MTQEEIDKKYMQRCIQLARNGWQNAKPNPMVGAVVVSGGRIIGEGYHVRCGEGHAEVNCLAAVKPADESLLHESTLYVSLEPCSHVGRTPPCADLIIEKRVPRVVVGCIDPFDKVQGRGIRKLQEAGVEVVVGVLENECRELNKRFFIVHAAHRPYILLKWAQTADGFLDDHFKPIQISTAFTKMLTHKLRAENDAILVGRVTAERDHPRLDVREWSGRNPQRFMLSSETSIDEILEECCQKGLQSLLVEGGRKTLESFMERDLWDEIRVETGTMVVGAGTCAPQLPDHQKLVRLENYDGNEIVTYERKS
ncbi:MAG: bifunctional diaminohydroxyphosphoribosylaminopyrimidine deaminase/5-amino-6-(5-phosphoribosylamino)uracil reductase RibD [Prevotella sp.]